MSRINWELQTDNLIDLNKMSEQDKRQYIRDVTAKLYIELVESALNNDEKIEILQLMIETVKQDKELS